ncbi:MAG: hypothetical protein ACO1QB_04350 [Verrucomicrobiales bacterium]
MEKAEQVTFQDWVNYLFDHEVTEPAWYWDDPKPISLEAPIYINYGTNLLKKAGELTSPYSDGQINQGLYRLVSINLSDEVFALRNPEVPLNGREEFLGSILELNRDCFASRCTKHLSHFDKTGEESGASPLNWICYMWWDIFVVYGNRDDPAEEPLNRACLAVMEQCLTIPHIAVQEGALHGLGHFKHYYPEESKRIIQNFMHSNSKLDQPLRIYAEAAYEGMMQ